MTKTNEIKGHLIEDMGYLEDDSIKERVNEIKELIIELKDIISEGNIVNIENLPNYESLKNKIREFNIIPSLVGYNGAVYLPKITRTRLSIKSSQQDKLGVEVIGLKLERAFGLDNNMSHSSLFDQRGLDEYTGGSIYEFSYERNLQNGNKTILLDSFLYHKKERENIINGEFGDDTNYQHPELLEVSSRYGTRIDYDDFYGNQEYGTNKEHKFEYEGDFSHSRKSRNIEYSRLRDEYEGIKDVDYTDILGCKFNIQGNIVDEIYNAKDSDGNTMLNGLLDIETNHLNYYSHVLYNGLKYHITTENLIGMVKRPKDFNKSNYGDVLLRKSSIEHFSTNSGVKRIISEYLKNSIIYVERNYREHPYIYNNKRFNCFKDGRDFYKNGFTIDKVFTSKKTLVFGENQFRNKHIRVSNIISSSTSEIKTYDSKSVEFNALFIRNKHTENKRNLRIGLQTSKIKRRLNLYDNTHSLLVDYLVGDNIYKYGMDVKFTSTHKENNRKSYMLSSNNQLIDPYDDGISKDEYQKIKMGFYDIVDKEEYDSMFGGNIESSNREDYNNHVDLNYLETYDIRSSKREEVVKVMPLSDNGMEHFQNFIEQDPIKYMVYLDSDISSNGIFE